MAAVSFAAAWSLGWPAARLYRVAAWCLPVTGDYVLAAAVQAGTWQGTALQPARDWAAASRQLLHGAVLPAAVVAVPPGSPSAPRCGHGGPARWRTGCTGAARSPR
jgi:hypothetical protein